MVKIGCVGETFVEGFDVFEFQFETRVFLKELAAKSVKSKAGKTVLNVHAPYYNTLASPKMQKVRFAINRAYETAKIAKFLGSRILVVHPGFYSKQTPEEAFENVKMACESLTSKIKGIQIGIETMGRQSHFGTIEEVLKLSAEVSGIVPVLNFSSIHARSNGNVSRQKDFEKILKKVDNPYCHFSGVKYKHGNELKLVSLEKSSFPWESLAKACAGIECTVVCDSPTSVTDALMFKKYLEEN